MIRERRKIGERVMESSLPRLFCEVWAVHTRLVYSCDNSSINEKLNTLLLLTCFASPSASNELENDRRDFLYTATEVLTVTAVPPCRPQRENILTPYILIRHSFIPTKQVKSYLYQPVGLLASPVYPPLYFVLNVNSLTSSTHILRV